MKIKAFANHTVMLLFLAASMGTSPAGGASINPVFAPSWELHDLNGKTVKSFDFAGQAAIEGYLDDYAFVIQGLLDLYEASFDIKYLTWAIALQKTQDTLFWDKDGGYFTTTGSDPSILLRAKDDYDGSEPSGNSAWFKNGFHIPVGTPLRGVRGRLGEPSLPVTRKAPLLNHAGNSIAVLNLLRLSQMTDSAELRQKAEQSLVMFGSRLRRGPPAMPQMMVAFDFNLAKPKQIIIVGHPGAFDTRAMLREVNSRFIPNKILLLADGGAGQKVLAGYLEFIKSVQMLDGKATAYVCENSVCKLPTSDIAKLAALITPLKNEERKSPLKNINIRSQR